MPTSAASRVLPIEAPLSRLQKRFLACPGDAAHCPYELRYQSRPAAGMEEE